MSSSGAASSGLVAFSRADGGGAFGAGRGGAERPGAVGRPHRGRVRQRRPGGAASAYWARASSSVRSAPSRSVRAADADDQRPAGEHPELAWRRPGAGRTGARRCGRGWPARAGSARRGRPRRRRRARVWSKARVPGGGGQDRSRRRRRRAARAPDRKSACRWVSAANATVSPRRVGGRAQRRAGPGAGPRPGPGRRRGRQVGAVAQPLVDQRDQVIVGEAHQVLQVSRRGGRLSTQPQLQYSMELWRMRMGDPARKAALFDAVRPRRQGAGQRQAAGAARSARPGRAHRRRAGQGRGAESDHRLGAPADPQAGRTGGHPPRRHTHPLPARRATTSPPCYALLRQVAADPPGRRRAPPAPPTSATTATPSRSTATSCCAAPQAGEVVVLDVRPAEEYAAGHIPGALSIPVDELADRLAELPDDAEVVAYCRGAYCVLAHDAVRLLHDRGRRAVRLTDGMLEWRLADLPVASGSRRVIPAHPDLAGGPVYLDYNATTPVDPRVAEAMRPYLADWFGNPSSGHAYGDRAHAGPRPRPRPGRRADRRGRRGDRVHRLRLGGRQPRPARRRPRRQDRPPACDHPGHRAPRRAGDLPRPGAPARRSR